MKIVNWNNKQRKKKKTYCGPNYDKHFLGGVIPAILQGGSYDMRQCHNKALRVESLIDKLEIVTSSNKKQRKKKTYCSPNYNKHHFGGVVSSLPFVGW